MHLTISFFYLFIYFFIKSQAHAKLTQVYFLAIGIYSVYLMENIISIANASPFSSSFHLVF